MDENWDKDLQLVPYWNYEVMIFWFKRILIIKKNW